MDAFAAPNRASVMNSLPAEDRGAGGGMNTTVQNSAQVLSLGLFFSVLIAGLPAVLPRTMASGLVRHGVPARVAAQIGYLPPVSILFSAFLGYNPIRQLVGSRVLSHLSRAHVAALTGRDDFAAPISKPFHAGLHEALTFAIIACRIAAAAPWSRGKRYVHGQGGGVDRSGRDGPHATVGGAGQPPTA